MSNPDLSQWKNVAALINAVADATGVRLTPYKVRQLVNIVSRENPTDNRELIYPPEAADWLVTYVRTGQFPNIFKQ